MFTCRWNVNAARLFSILAAVLFSFTGATATTIPADLNKIVTTILVPQPQGNPVAKGTGFFVVVKDPTKPDNAFGYLVTAKHVLQNSEGQLYDHVFVKLNKNKGGVELVRIDLKANGKSAIYTLPNPAIDLAVVPALPNAGVYDFRAIPEDMIQSPKAFSDLEMGEGSEVFFVGVLQSYADPQVTIPIARFGHVALLSGGLPWRPDRAAPVKPMQLVLIEGQSFIGDAGTPVFLMPNPDDAIESFITELPVYKLLGVMVGDYNPWEAAPDTVSPAMGEPRNIHVEAVAPSFLLYQIIESDELQRQRGGTVEQAKK